MAKLGEATSSAFAPSSEAMARARNVFPAPRSPTRWTTASGGKVRAISRPAAAVSRSEEHTSELQSRQYLVCRLLLEKTLDRRGRAVALRLHRLRAGGRAACRRPRGPHRPARQQQVGLRALSRPDLARRPTARGYHPH